MRLPTIIRNRGSSVYGHSSRRSLAMANGEESSTRPLDVQPQWRRWRCWMEVVCSSENQRYRIADRFIPIHLDNQLARLRKAKRVYQTAKGVPAANLRAEDHQRIVNYIYFCSGKREHGGCLFCGHHSAGSRQLECVILVCRAHDNTPVTQ